MHALTLKFYQAILPNKLYLPVICKVNAVEVSEFFTSFFTLNRRDFKLLFSSKDLSKCCLNVS